jgi:hypothetical protein
MGGSHLRVDFGLIVQGLSLSWQFSLRSASAFAGLGEFVLRNVYEFGSLTRTPTGLSFNLRNPPLRMGAFSGIAVFLDGNQVPPSAIRLQFADEPNLLSLAQVSAENPVVIPIGRRTRFSLDTPPVSPGRHGFRLEMQSVAIPPLAWFEFDDILRPSVESA